MWLQIQLWNFNNLSVLGILYYAINGNVKFVNFAAFLRLKLLEFCLNPLELQIKKEKSIKCHKRSKSSLDFNSLFWVIFIMEVRPNDMHYALSHSWQYKIIIVKKKERLNILLYK